MLVDLPNKVSTLCAEGEYFATIRRDVRNALSSEGVAQMFDVWMGDIELTTFTLIFSIVVLLPVQLLLCFKVKSKAIRLLPVILLSIPTLFFIVMAAITTGWDNLGYMFLVVFMGFMLLMCGIGWGVWWMINRKKQNKIQRR